MCEFCKAYEKRRIMETEIKKGVITENRHIKAGLILSVTNSFANFWNAENITEGVFNLNYCPECGRRLADDS